MSFSSSSFILKNDDTLWGCGYNGYGQLGLKDTDDRTMFTQITTNTYDIKSVYCGYRHAFILKNDDTLWACGDNQYGQLGLGDTSRRYTFTQVITNVNDVKTIYCGYNYTFILKNDGTLWGCGQNSKGQLGLGDAGAGDKSTFTKITTNAYNVKLVHCGSQYAIILKNDGTLWGCGYNNDGELGLGDTTNRNTFTQITTNANDIKSICCGNGHTVILKNDGTLWGSGWNSDGQLGLGDTSNRYTFTQITTNTNDIKSIYNGYNRTFILKNDGTLWGCGYNDYGQLGLGDTNDKKRLPKLLLIQII